MDPEGSPSSQQSLRSRPNYPHPILLEDGRSRAGEAAMGSPNSPLSAQFVSEYDPEAPYPHHEAPYGYVPQGVPIAAQNAGTARMGSNQSSPTGMWPPHHFNPNQTSTPSQTSPSVSPPTGSTSSQIPEPEYYHGVFAGATTAGTPQTAPYTTSPNGGYSCVLCSLNFTRAHDARRHFMSKHSDVRCQCVCGKKFSRKDALLRHQRPDNVSGYGGCEEAQTTMADP